MLKKEKGNVNSGVIPHLQIGLKEREFISFAVLSATTTIIVKEKEKEKEYFDSGVKPRTPIVIILKGRKDINLAAFAAETTNGIIIVNFGKGVISTPPAPAQTAIWINFGLKGERESVGWGTAVVPIPAQQQATQDIIIVKFVCGYVCEGEERDCFNCGSAVTAQTIGYYDNCFNGIIAPILGAFATIIEERERALLYALNATEFGGLFGFVCGLLCYPPNGDIVCGLFNKGLLCPEQQRIGIEFGAVCTAIQQLESDNVWEVK